MGETDFMAPGVHRRKRVSALIVPLLLLLSPGGAEAGTNPPLGFSGGGKLVIATNRARVSGASTSSTAAFSAKDRAEQISFAVVDTPQVGTVDENPLKAQLVEARDVPQLFARRSGMRDVPHAVLLYVHGFDNTTESAVHLANHVGNKIGFKGDVVVFAWPSRGSGTPHSYRTDAAMAHKSKQALSDLLQKLNADPFIDRIHIISHSLGNRVLVRAMALMPRLSKLGDIVLCSPDVERTEFLSTVPSLVPFARGATLWVSNRDRALFFAPTFGGGGPRAGLISRGSEAIVLPNLATIDVSQETMAFDYNHNAYMQVDDLFADLKDVFDPRALRPWLNPAKQRHYQRRATRDSKIFYEFKR